MSTLQNQVYLVAGAGGGIGSAIATELGRQGVTVVLLGRSLAPLERTYDAIVTAGGSAPALFPMDFTATVDDNFESLAQAIRFQLGRLDGIVHAASAYLPPSPLAIQTSAQWLEQFKVNCLAPFLINQACSPLLSAAPRASVVQLSETHAHAPNAYWGGFAVTKAAAENYFAIQVAEWHELNHVHPYLIVPGPIRSPQRAQTHPGENKSALPTPEQLAIDIIDLIATPNAALRGQALSWQPGQFSVRR